MTLNVLHTKKVYSVVFFYLIKRITSNIAKLKKSDLHQTIIIYLFIKSMSRNSFDKVMFTIILNIKQYFLKTN